MDIKRFTREELADYDGRDGAAAYIAYEGKIYDVTDSPMWENGLHEFEHEAGLDLTAEMEDAPHGEESMEDFPVVGYLGD